MNVTIYGLVGYAGRHDVPLESLDIEDLAEGTEFEYAGRIYEIRSVLEQEQGILLNVRLVMHSARA